ncbi:MAG: energy transducer TonB [Gemmatimonadales bacterium]|nr:energy transducer TonB [Gemmatimonadales bacterium]
MRPTLLESGRNFFQSAECALLSFLAHAAVVLFAVSLTADGRQIPADEREARVFFLLPPDRVDVRTRQFEIRQWGKLGGDLEDGKYLLEPDGGWLSLKPAHGARGRRERSGARGQVPVGPPSPFIPDTAFSVLEVDEIVERYGSSAAPIYPSDLMAIGAEGLVQATYVVDTAGQVDTTTVRVVYSDDPRFTASVRAALGQTRFRPARRAGKTVRQLVEQKFRFKIVPAEEFAKQISSRESGVLSR